MPKEVTNYVVDALLAAAAEGDRMFVRDTYNVGDSYATVSTGALATAIITPGDGNGDFNINVGDAGGQSRKLTVQQQVDINIDNSGNAQHVVIADSVNSRVLFTTTVTSQALTAGGTVTVNPYDLEVGEVT